MRNSSRRGFTLPEVLVTVTIIAVLAAVVVPAVVQNVKKGDTPAYLSDANAVKTAITAFASDVRQFPKQLDELTGSTLAAGNDIFNTPYASTSGYKGPYFSTTQNLATGFTPAGYSLVRWDNVFGKPDVGASCPNMIHLKANNATSITVEQIAALDKSLDGGTGVAAATNTTGALRWTAAAATGTMVAGDSIWYCLIPATN